jgi:hypothetical protein
MLEKLHIQKGITYNISKVLNTIQNSQTLNLLNSKYEGVIEQILQQKSEYFWRR